MLYIDLLLLGIQEFVQGTQRNALSSKRLQGLMLSSGVSAPHASNEERVRDE